MEYDEELFEAIETVCNMIDACLFKCLLDKTILENEKYMILVRKQDGIEYEAQNFSDLRLKHFKLLFLTSAQYPCDKLISLTMPVRIVVNNRE